MTEVTKIETEAATASHKSIASALAAAQAEKEAAVAAEREACAKVCSDTVKNYSIMKPGKPDVYASREAQICTKGMVHLVEEDIRSLTPSDALAARDARVRAEALREAAKECEKVRQDIASGPAPEGACFDYEHAILALIERDQTDE